MQKFFFQAVTAEGKHISGTMEGEDEAAVREKLGNAKLAILDIEDFDPSKHIDASLQVFEFAGHNVEGKVIKGTIESPEAYEAYKKLRIEYSLTVDFLVPAEWSEEQKQAAKTQGIDPEFEKRLFAEGKKVKKEVSERDKLQADNQKMIDRALETRQKEAELIRAEISNLVNQVNQMLEEQKEFIDPVKRRNIEKQLDLLSRIKYSNATNHLKKLIERLFQDLMSGDLFINKTEVHADDLPQYEEAKEKVHFFAHNSRIHMKSKIREIQLIATGLSADEIKKQLESWEISRVIQTIIYFSFVFFVLIALISVLIAGILNIVGLGELWDIIFYSYSFWYIFGIAFFVTLFFGLDFEIKWRRTIHKYYFKGGITIAFVLLYTLNSQGLFLWTL